LLADRSEQCLIDSLKRQPPEEMSRYFMAVRALELAKVLKLLGGGERTAVVEAINAGLTGAGARCLLVPMD
jgi:hypothetical protein